MSVTRYTKDGRSVRVEIDNGTRSELSLEERGEAVEHTCAFECATRPGTTAVEPDELEQIPAGLLELLERQGQNLERATIVTGSARHEIDVDGVTRAWSEKSVRVYASMTNRREKVRCEFDRGAASFLAHWNEELLELRNAVAAFDPAVSITSPIVIEPSVTAAIIATLWSDGLHLSGPRLVQIPSENARDGYGSVLEEEPVLTARGGSAWFRPSYRIRPQLVPHHIDIVSESAQLDLPSNRAIALTGPIEMLGGLLRVPSLITGSEGSGGTNLEIDVSAWDEQIVSVSQRQELFPLLAGVWGRRLLFTGSTLKTSCHPERMTALSPEVQVATRSADQSASYRGPESRRAGAAFPIPARDSCSSFPGGSVKARPPRPRSP